MYKSLIDKQKLFLKENGPLSLDFRLNALSKLKSSLKKYESDIMSALKSDLGKCEMEAYTTEIGFIYDSIGYTMKNLKKWIRPKRVKNDLGQFLGKSYIYPSHYGSVLIIGPYNYPLQLVIEPLIGAIAGGNTCVIKPSEFTPKTESILEKIIEDVFPSDYISLVKGDYKVNSELLDLDFDYIFFTGSVRVGKIVMEKASKNLTPITLELGGKSPTIVDSSADISLAAKKIVWGKLLNAGQTCIAPDYILAHEDIAEKLIETIKTTINDFYGSDLSANSEYGKIVNAKHTSRLISILDGDRDKIVYGGDTIEEERFIGPAIIYPMNLGDKCMEDELFGPILPIASYRSNKDIDVFLQEHSNPLALYVFSRDKEFAEDIISRYSFGSGCINDIIIQVASKYLPFGGVKTSGMGSYHGRSSFDTFTYKKTIVKKSGRFDFDIIYPPYGDKLKWVKKLMK